MAGLAVAARDGERGPVEVERAEPGEQVVGVQASGIEANVEVDLAVSGDQIHQPLAESGIAGGRLDHFEVGGGGVQVGGQEGDVVTVPGRVDADADVDNRRVASGRGAW